MRAHRDLFPRNQENFRGQLVKCGSARLTMQGNTRLAAEGTGREQVVDSQRGLSTVTKMNIEYRARSDEGKKGIEEMIPTQRLIGKDKPDTSFLVRCQGGMRRSPT